MLGNCEAVPLNRTLAIVRLVSVANSFVETVTPGTMLLQYFGCVGCVYTMAPLRFSSSYTGQNDLSPRYLSPKLVKRLMPSAFSVSKEYAISLRLPSVSGSGTE